MHRKSYLLSICLAVTLFAAGCSTEKKSENIEVAKAPEAPKETPASFRVKFDTSKGPFVVEVVREWAPNGADRVYELVNQKFYDDSRFFRVLKGFVAQFGLNGDPKVNQLWSQLKIIDDPAKQKNQRGYVTFATSGPNTRTTQLFINLRDNPNLDSRGFAPIGRVVDDGMDVVDKLYSSYGDSITRGGNGPDASRIQGMGNEYLIRQFPQLDYVKTARIEK